MMSPQAENTVSKELLKKRDDKYQISSDSLASSRANINVPPEILNTCADYWKQSGKGFAIDVLETELKTTAPFP